MKTYWLVGKKAVDDETAQSFVSFVGGRNPIAICSHSETDRISNSALGQINLQLSGQYKPDDDKEGDSLNWPIEENEVIYPQKDSPVAYYGHVPHTPQNKRINGLSFQWDKDKV